MKLGIHAYAYCSQWSNETLDLIPKRTKRITSEWLNEAHYKCLEFRDTY